MRIEICCCVCQYEREDKVASYVNFLILLVSRMVIGLLVNYSNFQNTDGHDVDREMAKSGEMRVKMRL